ncbi:MAG: ABC transporter permease [Oscillospiraceae bacterium]|nr:ABC transporter permease [Oscillospiraceae bacterium]
MKKTGRIFSSVYAGLIFLFLYTPIFILVIFSFNASRSRAVWAGFTFDWYIKLFGNDFLIAALRNTLVLAFVSSAAAALIGTTAALGIFAMKKTGKTILLNLTYLPIFNPEIVTGVSFMLLFAFLNMKLGFLTLLIAHISFSIPYVILNVMPKLRQLDIYQYEAALDLGCNSYQAFFKVVIPEIFPGILSGFLMAFTYSIDDFVISYFTTGPEMQTLPVAIFSMIRRQVSPEINALSAIMFLVVLILLILMNIKDIRGSKKRELKYFEQRKGKNL